MRFRSCLAVIALALALVGAGASAQIIGSPRRVTVPAQTQPGSALSNAAGQGNAAPEQAIVRPERRINRNPAFREDRPPAPAPRDSDRATIPPQTTDSARVTLVPHPGPCDPRNSTTRPVRIPESDNPAASPCVRQ